MPRENISAEKMVVALMWLKIVSFVEAVRA
jgi:hypothetical protein